MSRIGFIGLGRMGRGMAARLIQHGHELVVFNRSPAKATALLTAGAVWAESPRAAAQSTDAVLVMVSDEAASRAVWLGEDGVLAASTRSGAFAIECSTLPHQWVIELGMAAHDAGLRFLDCPVTGLPDAAAAGELTLLIGAEANDVRDAEPFLSPLARDWLHFGPIGAGTAYKLIINLIGAVQIASAAEGMAIAELAGLDLDLVADAIASGQAASPQVVRNTRRIADDSHQDVIFTGNLRRKDALYGVRLAGQLGIGAPFGEAALANLDRLIEMGHGELNESAIIDVARKARIPNRHALGTLDQMLSGPESA